jgi:hypothetical protein
MRNSMWGHKNSPKESESEFSTLYSTPEDENAWLSQKVREMYAQDKQDAIDRVWLRLVSERTGALQSGNEELSESEFQRQGSFVERNVGMRRMERTPMHCRRSSRVLSVFAAVLIGLVLVGSLTFVINMVRDNASTSTASSSKLCDEDANQYDPQIKLEQRLCAQHKETTLNIAKTFSTASFGTHKVVFIRAYADSNQLFLVNTTSDSPSSDAISFTSIEIQHQNMNGHQMGCYTGAHGVQYCINEFDMPNVPAGTKQISVQSITDAFSGKATPLQFTIPFHVELGTIAVNKTVMSKNVSLTLEQIVITGNKIDV